MFNSITKELFFLLNCVFYLSCLENLNGLAANVVGIIDFLKDVQVLHGFQNVLIMQNRNSTFPRQFVWEIHNEHNAASVFGNVAIELDLDLDRSGEFVKSLMLELQVPVLLMNELSNINLKRYFSDEMLTIVLIDGSWADHFGLLRNLVLNLRHMTVSKIIFLLNYEEEQSVEILTTLFRYCWSSKLLNTVALFKDYETSTVFYSYTNFPQFSLESKQLPTSKALIQEIFPYRLSNLHGYKLRFIIGGSDPRIIMYKNKEGKVVVAGFVGHFLEAFAQKYNCQLYEPLPAKIDAFAPSQDLVAAVRNGTVDISVALTFPSIPISGFSYPYEQMNWCVMMPVEPDIPDYEFYIIVFELTAFLITLAAIVIISMVLSAALYRHGYRADLLDIILHDDCLRGALGQPFSEVINAPPVVRFIYLQICVLGILLTTSYNAYFATYVTSAPKEPARNTFDDIYASGIKVYAYTPEFNELVGRVPEFRRYIPMFYLENNFRAYLKMRDSFNTEFGYMMPTTKWKIVAEQQKIFTTPIFKRNEDSCFFNNIPMCFPVHENSVFMQTLYQLMLELAQSGLTDHWQKIGFLEMIVAGKLSFADLSTTRAFEAMQVEDLFYVWLGFAFMASLTSLVFLSELCIFHRKNLWGFGRRFLRRPRWCSTEIFIKN